MSEPAAAGTAPTERTALDRFLAAVPVAIAALVVLSILFWEAAVRKSPTIFTDELEWAQLSRSIAHTGHAARRGVPISFKSLYSFLIAPAWWLHSPASAYTAIKYLNTTVMASTAVPVYFLARRLVSPRAAVVAALGTLCTSALFYASLLVPEVLAYPVFALCAYTSVRALAGGGRRWWIAAIAVSLVAVEVRSELVAAGAALAVAAAFLWVVGPRGRRVRAGWSVADHIGAAVLLVGAFVVLNRLAAPHAHEWAYTTEYWKGRIWTLGFEAGSALAIGLGVLPAIAGLAALWVPERRDDPNWRAFAAYLAGSIVTFGTYTAIKAAYLSTIFATRVEERNLTYLAPLLLVGAVVYFSARRPWLPGLLTATAFVAWLVLGYGYQLDFPYYEAPGYGIATMANRAFYWNQHDIRLALAVAVLVALIVALLPRLRLHRTVGRSLIALAALTVATWMLAGEVTSARGSEHQAKLFVSHLPQPLNWVDRRTHRAGTTYLGQQVGVDIGLWLLEFWNPSIKHVYTLDGTAPGPGPTLTPDLASPDGELTSDPGLPYVLADNGVRLIGQIVSQPPHTNLLLTKVPSHPWRLKEADYGRSSDGWMQSDGAYAYFGPERRAGTLSVVVSRAGFCPTKAPTPTVTVRVGPVALDQQRLPVVRRPKFVDRFVLHNCTGRTLRFTVTPPVAVQIHVSSLVVPTQYGINDPRALGAQVGYGFTPS